RVGIGHRADDGAVRQCLDLLPERPQVTVELADRDRAQPVAGRLGRVLARVGQPADEQLDATLPHEGDELRIERVADGQVRRDGLDVLAGLLLQRRQRGGGLVLVDADVDAGQGRGCAECERTNGHAERTEQAVHFFTSRTSVLLDRALPSGALPVTVTRNFPAFRSFLGINSFMVTLRRPAASGLSAATTTFFFRDSTTCALPMPSARKRTATFHFFFLSALTFFLSFCTPNVSWGASVQACVADGGAMKLTGPMGSLSQPT